MGYTKKSQPSEFVCCSFPTTSPSNHHITTHHAMKLVSSLVHRVPLAGIRTARMRQVWAGQPEAWPVMACIGVGVCYSLGYMSFHWLGADPDVTCRRWKRTQALSERTYLWEEGAKFRINARK